MIVINIYLTICFKIWYLSIYIYLYGFKSALDDLIQFYFERKYNFLGYIYTNSRE